MPGRIARGERLQFRRYANRLVVRDDRRAAAARRGDDRARRAERGRARRAGRLHRVGQRLSARRSGGARDRRSDFCAAQQDLFNLTDGIGAISALYRNGIGARVIARRLETIYAAFHGLRETGADQLSGLARRAAAEVNAAGSKPAARRSSPLKRAAPTSEFTACFSRLDFLARCFEHRATRPITFIKRDADGLNTERKRQTADLRRGDGRARPASARD